MPPQLCFKCGIEYPESPEFWSSKAKALKFGFVSQCRKCELEQSTTRDSIRQWMKVYSTQSPCEEPMTKPKKVQRHNNSENYQESIFTEAKQESLHHISGQLMAIIDAILKKHPFAKDTPPIFIDLFAGPGTSSNGADGSPLIFCKNALRYPYHYVAHFYEQDPDTASTLIANLRPYAKPTYFVHSTNNAYISNILSRHQNHKQFGIAYADPSNADLVQSLNLLRQVSSCYPRVDILLNYAASSWKRQIQLDHYRNLLTLLPTIPKQLWFIREPISQFQWTMLLGTNLLDFKASEKAKWHDIRTDRGSTLLRRIAFTKKEITNSGTQLSLFGGTD